MRVLKWYVDTGLVQREKNGGNTYPVVGRTYDGFFWNEHLWISCQSRTCTRKPSNNAALVKCWRKCRGGTGMMCLGFQKVEQEPPLKSLRSKNPATQLGLLGSANFGRKLLWPLLAFQFESNWWTTLNKWIETASANLIAKKGDGFDHRVVSYRSTFASHQLKRIAIGVSNSGSLTRRNRPKLVSGDIFIAFSTGQLRRMLFSGMISLKGTMLPKWLNRSFAWSDGASCKKKPSSNAMIAAETMEGIKWDKSYALPHELLVTCWGNTTG